MNHDLEVSAWGVVSPGGNSLQALQQQSHGPSRSLPRLSKKTPSTPLHQIDHATLSRWHREPRLRRATPLTFFLVEAVGQCLEKSGDRKRVGLIIVNFTGSITYSRRFYQEIVEQGPRVASPMMFPETVFNSPASHVVSQHQIGGPVYSLLGDETAWIAGIETASLWLQLQKADEVILAAGYEIDAMSVEAYHAAGWIRKGMIPTEGAAAISLRRSDLSTNRLISQTEQGFIYRSKEEFLQARLEIEKQLGKPIPSSQAIWNPWTFSRTTSPMPHAFSVSVGWETILQLQQPREELIPILGANHQAGYIRLKGNPLLSIERNPPLI